MKTFTKAQQASVKKLNRQILNNDSANTLMRPQQREETHTDQSETVEVFSHSVEKLNEESDKESLISVQTSEKPPIKIEDD